MYAYESFESTGKWSVGKILPYTYLSFCFSYQQVHLHGSQQFKDTWSSVLLAAGCKIVTKIPSRIDYPCDVVVSEDVKLPGSIKYAADLLRIPIVSLEWLLQSLINGRQVPFDGHAKYDYRYKSA